MATRTIVVHDRCTVEGCGRTLHSINEGEHGLCSTHMVESWSAEKRAAIKKMIAAAFKPTEEEKTKALVEAVEMYRRAL